jgi:hypothetical protein
VSTRAQHIFNTCSAWDEFFHGFLALLAQSHSAEHESGGPKSAGSPVIIFHYPVIFKLNGAFQSIERAVWLSMIY